MSATGFESITDEIVNAASNGDVQAREHVLEALMSQVRAMITVRLSPTPAQFHAVEDLAQQSLMAVSDGLETLREPTRAVLKSFTSTIVTRNVAKFLSNPDSMKAHGVKSLDSSIHDHASHGPLWALLSASGISPSSAFSNSERIDQILTELGRLKTAYRDVIILAFFDQLPVREIARRMDLSRPAASMLLMRAVRALRRRVVDEPAPDTEDERP